MKISVWKLTTMRDGGSLTETPFWNMDEAELAFRNFLNGNLSMTLLNAGDKLECDIRIGHTYRNTDPDQPYAHGTVKRAHHTDVAILRKYEVEV